MGAYQSGCSSLAVIVNAPGFKSAVPSALNTTGFPSELKVVIVSSTREIITDSTVETGIDSVFCGPLSALIIGAGIGREIAITPLCNRDEEGDWDGNCEHADKSTELTPPTNVRMKPFLEF